MATILRLAWEGAEEWVRSDPGELKRRSTRRKSEFVITAGAGVVRGAVGGGSAAGSVCVVVAGAGVRIRRGLTGLRARGGCRLRRCRWRGRESPKRRENWDCGH